MTPLPNTTTLGTCSLCGGAVTVPTVVGSVVLPTPTCSQCGAVPAQAHGPVIPMQPAPRVSVSTSANSAALQALRGAVFVVDGRKTSLAPRLEHLCAVGPMQSGTLRAYKA